MEKSKKKSELKVDSNAHFQTFKSKGRLVTVCLVLTSDNELVVGHSICNPQDSFSSDLAERISVGRALKESSRIGKLEVKPEYLKDEILSFLLDGMVDIISKNPEEHLESFKHF